ncbi:hypothetical protein [Acetobacter malorum]|uniref:hypothetical protein n=1 Tax=Acetobacter malorum TaxID=178901 RepID=UPI0039E7D1C9
MSASNYYRSIISRASNAVNNMIEDSEPFTSFTALHNTCTDIEKIIFTVSDRPEAVLYNLALREFNYSLYTAATGNYRHAHIGLRMFLELFSAGVYFSAYEIKLRCWLNGLDGSDINWSCVSNAETGVFSVSFINAFETGLSSSAKQYRTIAVSTYRECSEFVHGNIHTQDLTSSPLSYNKDNLLAWIERAEAASLCAFFAFSGRYLSFLKNEKLDHVENIIMDRFGHLSSIQHFFA